MTTNLNAEVTRATAAEGTLTTNLNAEVTRAKAAEGTLTTNLNAEVTRATGAEATLTTNLNAETVRAKAAEGTLTTNLANEVTRATGAEGTLTTNLNAETVRAKGAESMLQTQINTIDGQIVVLQNQTQNITATAGQTNVAGNISVSGNANVGQSLNVAGNANIAGDANISGNANVAKNLAVGGGIQFAGDTFTGVANGTQADAKNQNVSTQGYVDQQVGLESARAQGAETALATAINNESTRAQKAEHKLDQKFSLVNATVGASLVNIVASELTPDELKEEGVAFTGFVGQNKGHDTAEVVIGLNKQLGNGFSAGVGVGTESGAIAAFAGYNNRIHENVNVGIGASISERGLQVGPHAELTDEEGKYGVGVGIFGPTVIVQGVNIPVMAPMVGVANAAVAGVTKIYNTIQEKHDAPVKALKVELAVAQEALAAEHAKVESLEERMAKLEAMLMAKEEAKAVKANKKHK